VDGRCVTIAERLPKARVILVNDLEAMAFAVPVLRATS
jgi:glucokinase